MIKQITNFLTEKRSYLKKGDEYLANKFGCSPRTINRIKRSLINIKRDYIASL